MIVKESEYLQFIISKGVGKNDRVASSPNSYVSYLKGVSNLLSIDISPATLSSEADVASILRRLKNLRSENTIKNYRSAMRKYVDFVQKHGHER